MSWPRQSGEKVVLEAPEQSKSVCAQCLRLVARPVTDCDEPMCPMQDEVVVGSGEAAFAPELARVNLLRMRGEYDAARTACLSILKKLPGSVTAHTLMGDIHSDQDDLPAALEWVDLALELDPASQVLQAKRHTLVHRIQDREAAETVQQLGIPTAKPQIKLFIWATVVFVAAVAVVGFLAGQSLWKDRVIPVYREPIQAGVSAPLVDDPTPTPTQTPASQPTTPNPAVAVTADTDALNRLRSESKENDRWLAVSIADRRAILTAALKDGEDAAKIAPELAAAAAGILRELASVTVRVVQNGSIVSVAQWPEPAPSTAPESAPKTEIKNEEPTDQPPAQNPPETESAPASGN